VVDNNELKEFIARAERSGAIVTVEIDEVLYATEGRKVIAQVHVHNATGIGPYPMDAISAAESLRAFLQRSAAKGEQMVKDEEMDTESEKPRDHLGFAFVQGFMERHLLGDSAGRTHPTDADWNDAYDSGMKLADLLISMSNCSMMVRSRTMPTATTRIRPISRL